MGIFGPKSDNQAPRYHETGAPAPADGNPCANRFEVLRLERWGDGVVAELKYLDSKNYGGRKILVFDNFDRFQDQVTRKDLDPHFLEDRYSPVARFEPTDRGWGLALRFLLVLEDSYQRPSYAAAAYGAAPLPFEPNYEFDLVLTGYEDRIKAIKALRALYGFTISEARDKVSHLPQVLRSNWGPADVNEEAGELREAGCTVSIRPS